MKREEIENMPAGREMDALVMEWVTEFAVNDNFYIPNYSTDMAAAWQVVEKLTDNGYCPGLIFDDNGHWALYLEGAQSVSFESEPTDTSTSFFVRKIEWCDAAPLAICRAALLALMDYDE